MFFCFLGDSQLKITLSLIGLGMDYEDHFLQSMVVALVTLEITPKQILCLVALDSGQSCHPTLAQNILLPICRFGKLTGSDPKVLTLIQGFDCGNKQDYLELCLILSEIFLH